MSQTNFEEPPGHRARAVSHDRPPPATRHARVPARGGVPAFWLTLVMLGAGTRAACGDPVTGTKTQYTVATFVSYRFGQQ
jgi:hypothetical protein